MAAATEFYALTEHLAEKVHNLGSDALTIALCAAANAPVVGNSVLADLTQISYTNCSARVLTISSSSQTSGVYKLVAADLTLTASGGTVGPFRYVVLYNDTPTSPADPLIQFWDYGSDITLAGGETFLLDCSAVNGILQLTL
jgi:hypothetical protein